MIDWGDGNLQTLTDPGSGSIDVAHAYPHVIGDDEIATGSLSSAGVEDSSHGEVTVKAYRKGPDGSNELTSITHYRIEVDGISPRVDKFSFNRVDGADGDIDTIDGRIAYPDLPNSITVSVLWSDGSTSNGVIEARNGEFWFSAVRNYTGKAPATMVGLRFINTTNSKVVGSFEIKPQSSATLAPASPSIHGAAPNQHHGDAGPVHRSNHALALHAPVGAAVTRSDLALMFGAGVLAVGSGLQKAATRPGRAQAGKPAVAAASSKWLAAPYRVPAGASADGNPDGWQEVDDWLVASDRGTAPPDTADWLIVRE